ncbi:hypothetical protein BHE74_00012320 [Ensete ventricosum]|nr:hypothetical protein GW17_00044267 [Ensete ventricosum]RWW79393.1 hypothetical protein BHE74_00012320 [Ensete ventricosum]
MKSMGYAPELNFGRHRSSWSSSRVDRKFLHKGLVEVGCPMWPFDAQVSAPAKVELESIATVPGRRRYGVLLDTWVFSLSINNPVGGDEGVEQGDGGDASNGGEILRADTLHFEPLSPQDLQINLRKRFHILRSDRENRLRTSFSSIGAPRPKIPREAARIEVRARKWRARSVCHQCRRK